VNSTRFVKKWLICFWEGDKKEGITLGNKGVIDKAAIEGVFQPIQSFFLFIK